MKLRYELLQTLIYTLALIACDIIAMFECAAQPGPIGGGLWVAQGGAPIWYGDASVANGAVAGAVQAVVMHPTDPNTMWIGAVNGGIWRTTNALATSVLWQPLTDFMPSLSIGALNLDPTDPTHGTLVAGLGSFSSDGGLGGSIHGVLRSTDAGITWAYLDGGGIFENKRISGVVSRGSTLILSVDVTSDNLVREIGVYGSTNSGSTFTQLSTATGQPYGLPIGRAIQLVGDPTTPAILYVAFRSQTGGAIGVYKSLDTGATWFKISNTAIDTLITTCDEGVRVSASFGNIVAVAIQDANNNQIPHLFWSNTGGTNWTDLGLPGATAEFGADLGSVLADPNNTNYVYVTGVAPWRCDLSQPLGSQWAQLYGPIAANPPNEGTTNSSSPHSDGRQMAFDLRGDLVLVCDGGIYLRTNPRSNIGGWSSINGNLQVGEIYSIAYDPLFHVCVAGTQDNGTQRQTSPGNLLWQVINISDGGDVAVDTTTSPGFSIVYVSYQGFGGFARRTYSSATTLVAVRNPSLSVIGGGAALQGEYVTPVNLNAINAERLVIGAANGVYESMDQGETVAEIGPGVQGFHRLAYGGWYEGVANTDVLYVPSTSGQIFVRTNASGFLSATATAFPGLKPNDIAILSTNWRTVFVVDSQSVYMSRDAGSSWTNITGNLTGVGQLRSIRASSTNGSPSILVGSDMGVYVSTTPNIGYWSKAGTNLPNAVIYDLDYNEAADVLVAGSHGRGAWLITSASSLLFTPQPPVIGLQPQSQSILIGATANFSVSVGGTPPFGFQWLKNGVEISGATKSNLRIGAAQPGDEGGYSIAVSNNLNSVTSLVARLSVSAWTSISSIKVSSAQLIITGVNWQSGGTYYLLSTTNLAFPLSQWTHVATNFLSSSGTFTITVTNAFALTNPRRFYALQLHSPAGMTLIPAGSFAMGDTLDGESDAVPSVNVNVSAFYMDINLVSYGQWQSTFSWAMNHGYGFDDVGSGKAANHPVQSVNWFNAVKWINARSEQANLTPVYYADASFTQTYVSGQVAPFVNWSASGYRLPTEAEWEKAARGGLIGQRFPWGDVITESVANYVGDTSGFSYDLGPNGSNAAFTSGGQPYTSPVGYFAANGYGLCDMAGNVDEFCWDWYGTGLNGADDYVANSTDPHGPATGSSRVLRGGSWVNQAGNMRCASRHFFGPGSPENNFGFRCVIGL